jgi:hypothetical protein
MFQGKLPRPGDARPLSVVQEDTGYLRELTWADLVAALKASRARRGAGHEEAGEGVDASFDASCAKRIAAQHSGKQAVNLEGSSYGKEAGHTLGEEQKGAGADNAPDAARK